MSEKKKKEEKEDDHILRTKDVAHLWDCSPDDIGDMARNGWPGARKIGRYWKFSYAAVMKHRKKLIRQGYISV